MAEAVRRPGGSELARAPMLWPCPSCGGQGDYRYADGLDVYAVCTRCGLRTADHVNPLHAGRAWNRRTTEGARVISVAELLNSEFGYCDDAGAAAVWIETRDEGVRAALLIVGLDMGEPTVTEITPEGESVTWGPDEMAAEGELWRIWSWKPNADDRARAAWDGESWKAWGALRDIQKTEETSE